MAELRCQQRTKYHCNHAEPQQSAFHNIDSLFLTVMLYNIIMIVH